MIRADARNDRATVEGRPRLADISIKAIGHVDWVDEDLDKISFVRVTKKGVQVNSSVRPAE